jgi:carbamoyltransferase
MFIQPAAGDGGGALGAALHVYHGLLGNPRGFVLEHAYWGQDFAAGEIASFLDGQGIAYETFSDESKLESRVVEDLENGKVVGLFQGRFEWGPRALGNRSILADPRSEEMKDLVNVKIKFREPFRPFAPVILEEAAGDYFEGGDIVRQYPARYMLMVLPFRPGMGDKVQAVNHGGTGRLQTIRREWNPRYYELVRQFGEATGVPVLMNTSFNLRGEPIVTSPANAVSTFSRSGIDVLVMENFLIRKS